jgi:hypothetical protein
LTVAVSVSIMWTIAFRQAGWCSSGGGRAVWEYRWVARTWLSIRVDLIGGRGEVFAASRSHTFWQLAEAIDGAFARWDRAHLYQFDLSDGGRIGRLDWDEEAEDLLDGRQVRLGRLGAGEQFVYEFDFGDSWTHLCTVAEQRIDPLAQLGIVPEKPLPFWGWGVVPDQYGRRWDGDDGESDGPGPDPGLRDLPPLRPWWGPRSR